MLRAYQYMCTGMLLLFQSEIERSSSVRSCGIPYAHYFRDLILRVVGYTLHFEGLVVLMMSGALGRP